MWQTAIPDLYCLIKSMIAFREKSVDSGGKVRESAEPARMAMSRN